MKLVGWMAALSVTGWLAAVALAGPALGLEILLGMVGPLLMTSGSWALAERTYRRSPERLTPLMVAAFFGKMVFFGAYVAVMLRVPSLRPIPFVVSFTSYFIALHLTEALCLRRLFAGGTRGL